jgi:uncharacterized protein (TIGR03437 family)
MKATGGHSVVAVFSGSANFAPSTSEPAAIPALINAAGGAAANIAPDEFVSLFGPDLAVATAHAGAAPYPDVLGGISVAVRDSAGVTRAAGIAYVSPTQINFVIPKDTARGDGLILLAGDGRFVPVAVQVGGVAPGLFSATGNGQGVAAAYIVRIRADGTQTLEGVSEPIQMGTDTLYLVLYGTGFRNRTALANVSCTIGGRSLAPLYAGAQGDYPGLDQMNVALPETLKGAGQVTVSVTVDDQVSNAVTLVFR